MAIGASVVGAAWAVDAIRRGRRSSRLHRVLVDLLLNTLSAGDPVTERHSRRVANLADVLFRKFRLPASSHPTLRIAALLHDLGKIDDRFFPILHSYAPLTAEERALIEEHPQEGADILEPLEQIHPGVTAIVESHHECWDGDGYPRGLRGEEIPIGARIISLTDVLDAMTQPRSYRPPLPFDEALEQIRRGSGSRFDPAVVEALYDPYVSGQLQRIVSAGRKEEEACRLAAESGDGSNGLTGSQIPRGPSEPRSGSAGRAGSPADRSNNK